MRVPIDTHLPRTATTPRVSVVAGERLDRRVDYVLIATGHRITNKAIQVAAVDLDATIAQLENARRALHAMRVATAPGPPPAPVCAACNHAVHEDQCGALNVDQCGGMAHIRSVCRCTSSDVVAIPDDYRSAPTPEDNPA